MGDRRKRGWISAGFLLASAAAASAQENPPAGPPQGQPPAESPPAERGAELVPVDSRYFQLPSYDRYGLRSRANPFNFGEVGEYPLVGARGLLDPYIVNVLKGD